MALPAQYARVAFNGSIADVRWQNIAWFDISGSFSSSFDIQAAAASVDTDFEAAFRSCMGVDAFYNGVDLRVNNAGVTDDASTLLSAAGTGVNNSAPPEVSAIIQLRTVTPGKPGRGRIYLGGIDNASTNGGKIDPVFVAVYNILAAKFKTSLAVQGQVWNPCILSRAVAGGPLLLPIVNTVLDSVLGTQRRRRPKR